MVIKLTSYSLFMGSHSYSQFFVLVLFGVIVGAIYYQVKRDDKGIQNRWVLSFVLCFLSFHDFSMHRLSVIGVTSTRPKWSMFLWSVSTDADWIQWCSGEREPLCAPPIAKSFLCHNRCDLRDYSDHLESSFVSPVTTCPVPWV